MTSFSDCFCTVCNQNYVVVACGSFIVADFCIGTNAAARHHSDRGQADSHGGRTRGSHTTLSQQKELPPILQAFSPLFPTQ